MNNESLVVKPTILSFITTNKCTAACNNCCFGCNPKKKNRILLDEMKSYIDQSLEAYSTIKLLVLTGGECFTLGKDLNEIIKYGTQAGLMVRIVTNAYWANSFEKAYKKLKDLVNSGLKEINISTGDEHQEWVPYDNIVYAISASLKLNLTVVVNVETSNLSKFNTKQLKEDDRLKEYFETDNKKLFVMDSVWMPFKKTTEKEMKSVLDNDNVQKICLSNTRCTNLFSTITINPFHHINACCGLTSECTPYLKLGNAKRYSVKQLYEHQFEDLLKIWLYTEGPKKILDFIYEKRNIDPLDTSHWHICQICAELFNNEENIRFLQKNKDLILPNIVLKYTMLRKYSV
ncbi:hypothetical protein FACS189437_08970 [Bacteroidia bacterium]|nr:hypothetical protein FACS189437_08970 [Bacteroidia bacterium]